MVSDFGSILSFLGFVSFHRALRFSNLAFGIWGLRLGLGIQHSLDFLFISFFFPPHSRRRG